MKLYRSRHDAKLFGLCGGIARNLGVDASWIRLAFVIGIFATSGVLFFVYVVASMMIPKEPAYGGFQPLGFAYAGAGGYQPTADPAFHYGQAARSRASGDNVIDDFERQTLIRELEQLRNRLAQLEQEHSKQTDQTKPQ